MNSETKDILEAVEFIMERMLTKDDVRELIRESIVELPTLGATRELLEEALAPIRSELAEINRRLDSLEENYRNLRDLTKEIDEQRDRVRKFIESVTATVR